MLSHIIEKLHLAADEKARSYMTKYFQMKGKIACLTCEGFGHTSKGCATKKRIDQATRKTEMRIVWGRHKSDLKMRSMSKKSDLAATLRKNTRKALIDAIRAIPLTPEDSRTITGQDNTPQDNNGGNGMNVE